MAIFVGRRPELALMRRLLDDLVGGREAAAVVTGAPGSGKSRLIDVATRDCVVPVLRLNGHLMEQSVPLAGARDLLRTLGEVAGSGVVLSELLFGRGEPAETLRVFESAYQALRDLAPALMVVDDLQWVDAESLALIHYLLRAANGERTPMVFLAAGRSTPNVAVMEEALARLFAPNFHTIELGPLEHEEATSLIRAMAPNLSPDEVYLVLQRARGSPFWMELLAGGQLEHIDNLLETRLHAVGSDAVRALEILTLAGRPFQAREIDGVIRWPPSRTDEAVQKLATQGVITTAKGDVAIAHDLLSEALLRRIPKNRAREGYLELAAWLEEEAGSDSFAISQALAYRRAGGDDGLDLARRLVLSPSRRLLGADLIAQLAAIASQAGTKGLQLRGHVGEMAAERGEFSLAIDQFAALAQKSELPDLRARAALRAAECALWLHRQQECRGFLEQARSDMGDDPEIAIETDALEARLLRWEEERPQEAALFTKRALDRLSKAQAVGRRARFAALKSVYDQALIAADLATMLDSAGAMAAEADSEEEALSAALDAALCLGPLGRWQEAERKLRSISQEARMQVRPDLVVRSGPPLAATLLAIGRLEEAMDVARESIALSDRLGGVAGAAIARRTLWLADLQMGQVRRSLAGLEADLERTDPHYRIGHHQVLAWWWARIEGEAAASKVAEHVDAGGDRIAEVGCPRCRAEFGVHAAEAWARAGQPEAARQTLARWERETSQVQPSWAFWKERAEAVLAPPHLATERWKRLVFEATRQGLLLEALWCRLDLAAAFEAVDQNQSSAELLDARAEASELGVLIVERLVDQRLRSGGKRTWRRGPRPSGRDLLHLLTAREREIAEMLASGTSNSEIASTLFISKKTVERHVSNIFVKLGARNRVEVAALVARQVEGEP
jgi:DNA-binding CsgD family transcriptional regulator